MTTENFIKQLYNNLLGRDAEPAGLAFWVEKIDTGTLSAAQLSKNFVDSSEFSSVVTPLALLYYTTFNRNPDPEGLAYWMQIYQSGISMGEIAHSFVGSSEFTQMIQ